VFFHEGWLIHLPFYLTTSALTVKLLPKFNKTAA
jgi:hypothetical protein